MLKLFKTMLIPLIIFASPAWASDESITVEVPAGGTSTVLFYDTGEALTWDDIPEGEVPPWEICPEGWSICYTPLGDIYYRNENPCPDPDDNPGQDDQPQTFRHR